MKCQKKLMGLIITRGGQLKPKNMVSYTLGQENLERALETTVLTCKIWTVTHFNDKTMKEYWKNLFWQAKIFNVTHFDCITLKNYWKNKFWQSEMPTVTQFEGKNLKNRWKNQLWPPEMSTVTHFEDKTLKNHWKNQSLDQKTLLFTKKTKKNNISWLFGGGAGILGKDWFFWFFWWIARFSH